MALQWNETVSGAPASGRESNYEPTPGPIPVVLRVKAGDRLAKVIEFVDDDTDAPEVLTSTHWAAHVRRNPSSEKVCQFTVDLTQAASGRLILRMEPEDSAKMRNGMRTDVVDLETQYTWFTIQWDVWGDYTHD